MRYARAIGVVGVVATSAATSVATPLVAEAEATTDRQSEAQTCLVRQVSLSRTDVICADRFDEMLLRAGDPDYRLGIGHDEWARLRLTRMAAQTGGSTASALGGEATIASAGGPYWMGTAWDQANASGNALVFETWSTSGCANGANFPLSGYWNDRARSYTNGLCSHGKMYDNVSGSGCATWTQTVQGSAFHTENLSSMSTSCIWIGSL